MLLKIRKRLTSIVPDPFSTDKYLLSTDPPMINFGYIRLQNIIRVIKTVILRNTIFEYNKNMVICYKYIGILDNWSILIIVDTKEVKYDNIPIINYIKSWK